MAQKGAGHQFINTWEVTLQSRMEKRQADGPERSSEKISGGTFANLAAEVKQGDTDLATRKNYFSRNDYGKQSF